jgi:hypothetical protein
MTSSVAACKGRCVQASGRTQTAIQLGSSVIRSCHHCICARARYQRCVHVVSSDTARSVCATVCATANITANIHAATAAATATAFKQVSLSDFLTLFSARTRGPFWEVKPGKLLVAAFVIAVGASTALACTWPFGEGAVPIRSKVCGTFAHLDVCGSIKPCFFTACLRCALLNKVMIQ